MKYQAQIYHSRDSINLMTNYQAIVNRVCSMNNFDSRQMQYTRQIQNSIQILASKMSLFVVLNFIALLSIKSFFVCHFHHF